MGSPRITEGGASRARRGLAGFAGILVVLALCGGLAVVPSRADEAEQLRQLRESRQELQHTRAKIRARAKQARVLQRGLNRLATQISLRRSEIARTDRRIAKLWAGIARLEAHARALQDQLDERGRTAYILGPGVPVLYLLTATSAADAASRMSFLDEMNRRDAVLAAKVDRTQMRLGRVRGELVRLQLSRERALQQLALDQAELHHKLARARRLFAELKVRRDAIRLEISEIRPFAVCPVQGPVAIADDFGIWVHHPKDEGGNHIHQGNDMSAATGTPIVAPFDGTAVASPNKIGGMAVKVFGEFGYVYNAHLSAYGTLGPVVTGDVVGYVGSTGNAGGPHDHFEWHPGEGKAVDPYDFLMLVC